MAISKRYKKITKRTENELAMGENDTVDYKKRIDGIKEEDLVAFANTESGGSVLLGVEEHKRMDG